jgi:prevent-host-death family protein
MPETVERRVIEILMVYRWSFNSYCVVLATAICYTVYMITIDVDEMQRDFSRYINRVNAGETVLILQGGTPIAELKPVEHTMEKRLRPYGLCAGEFTVPEDFDDPLPDEILAEFER